MAVPKAIASIKRFGARYGRTVKHKFGAIEAMQRKKYKCPYCSKPNVKRVAAGIWQCQKCNAKFASRAYNVAKKKSVKEMIAESLGEKIDAGKKKAEKEEEAEEEEEEEDNRA
jgi:large subunit ribosomal protein L37Ae